ncbi:MAG: TraB/GumN family protein [Sphingomonadales bacterium]|nr:TraB/GumN family protein [Sphingomonadales bacterium]
MALRPPFLLALAALLIGLQGCAAAPGTRSLAPPTSIATSYDRSDADPALWVIKDADTTIYLFGTIHLLEPDLVWFDDAVADAFNASDELVLEMIEPDAATAQRGILSRAIATDGIALRDRLNAEQRAKYDAAMAAHKLPTATYDKFEPWMAAISLSLAPMQRLGFDPDQGVEKSIADKARARRMTVSALESFDEQIAIFDSLPPADQIAFLMSVIDSLSEMQITMDRMVRAWATGDVAGLAALLNDTLSTTPTLDRALLHDRNARWATWVDERMQRSGTVFIAVGAGHLAGGDSVQAMLAERGVTAQRIDY